MSFGMYRCMPEFKSLVVLIPHAVGTVLLTEKEEKEPRILKNIEKYPNLFTWYFPVNENADNVKTENTLITISEFTVIERTMGS